MVHIKIILKKKKPCISNTVPELASLTAQLQYRSRPPSCQPVARETRAGKGRGLASFLSGAPQSHPHSPDRTQTQTQPRLHQPLLQAAVVTATSQGICTHPSLEQMTLPALRGRNRDPDNGHDLLESQTIGQSPALFPPALAPGKGQAHPSSPLPLENILP